MTDLILGTAGNTGLMLFLAAVFFVIGIVAYALGSTGIAGMDIGVGRTLLFVFSVLSVIFLAVGLFPPSPDYVDPLKEEGYKKGQQDYAEGIIHWRKHEVSKTEWEYSEKGFTGIQDK
jgi:uncharacterized membrane protein YtjA (UPF0391 family)